MAVADNTRLSATAQVVARLFISGRITIDDLRAQMRRAITEAHTATLLAATGNRRNAELNSLLRRIIEAEFTELERLIGLMQTREFDEAALTQRLSAFSDVLDETYTEAQRLAQDDTLSPLVPLAVGGALGALINRIAQQRQTAAPERTTLPRIDAPRLSRLRDVLGKRVDLLADDLAAGRMSADEWHEAMRNELRLIHETYARLGGGSVNEARLQEQWDYLDGFRADVDGLSADAVKRRARMYVSAGNTTLQEAALSRLGIDGLLPARPGERSSCLTNCKCFWDIQRIEGGYAAYWRLRPAEHCDECVARQAQWNPITIINGIVQPYSTIGVFV